MNESKGRTIIIGVLVFMVVILSGVVIYMYINQDDVNISLDNKEEVNDNQDDENVKMTEEQAVLLGKELYDKATDIYETWLFYPWCGYSDADIYNQSVHDFGGTYGNGFYKSPYNDLEELKEELRNYFSEDIINSKINGIIVIDWDLKNIDTYVNYVIKDNEMYCRSYSGKGWVTGYYDYDMIIDSIEDNKIVYNIKSKYILLNPSSNCMLENINACNENDFEYKYTKFVIEKNDSGNWVVTDYTLHE